MTLLPNQTQCFYNIPVSAARYDFHKFTEDRPTMNQYYSTGEVLIEKCKSKTLKIR